MGNFVLATALGLATTLGWITLAPLQEVGAQSTKNLLGGPRGTVRDSRGFPLEGIMVQLISQKNSIRTTVYTDPLGKYEFPKLDGGDYTLRIPRPLEYRRYQRDSVRIDGAAPLGEITLERLTDSEFLPPTPDILPQLTEAEWLANLPGTGQEKKTFINTCGGSCHGFQNQFRARFDEPSWRKIVHRMSCQERILVQPVGAEMFYDPSTKHFGYRARPAGSGNGEGAGFADTAGARGASAEDLEMVVKWLSRVRGPGAVDPPMKAFARPQGPATRAIVTEYELPWEAAIVHDVAGDREGNIWFTINRSPFIGKLDPKTGKVTSYRTPTRENIHPGEHWIRVDKNGMVWFSDTWSRSLGRFNPRTEKFDMVYTGLHGNVALAPDGSIWRTDGGLIKKYDPANVFETGKPVQQFPLLKMKDTYGNFLSRDGNYFAGVGREIVFLDIRSGKVREVPVPSGNAGSGRGDFDPAGNVWFGSKMGMLVKYDPQANAVSEYVSPTPYTNFYSATTDKNGEVWAGEMHGGRVARFNPQNSRWTEYQLPTVWSFDYTNWIDNSTDPVSYWYGDYYGYIVHVQPLE